MKLDRNIEGNEGRGKYALLLLRDLRNFESQETFGGLAPEIANAIQVLENAGIIDWGNAETESEFFVIRLKDRFAQDALHAYADAARGHDSEYAAEIDRMASRAGGASPFCKIPD